MVPQGVLQDNTLWCSSLQEESISGIMRPLHDENQSTKRVHDPFQTSLLIWNKTTIEVGK